MERHDGILIQFWAYSPLAEGVHLGHLFLDLTGTRRLWGPANDAVLSIRPFGTLCPRPTEIRAFVPGVLPNASLGPWCIGDRCGVNFDRLGITHCSFLC